MISGIHVLFYSADPDADRAFFRDVLNFPAVDIGRGWLLFGLPPAEAAVHPVDQGAESTKGRQVTTQIYLMCDDVRGVMTTLASRGISCSTVHEKRWGLRTSLTLPSGAELGLYQPTHPTALKTGTA
jgi:hypothetical protein